MKEVKHIRYISIINTCKKFIKKNHKNKFIFLKYHYWMKLGEYKYYRYINRINRDMGLVISLNITKGNELYEEESKA